MIKIKGMQSGGVCVCGIKVPVVTVNELVVCVCVCMYCAVRSHTAVSLFHSKRHQGVCVFSKAAAPLDVYPGTSFGSKGTLIVLLNTNTASHTHTHTTLTS